jgi:uncharacterized protein with HEPN domain
LSQQDTILTNIDDILDNIRDIEESLSGLGYNDYLNNRKVKINIVEKFEDIIFKVMKVPNGIKEEHPGEFWNEVISLQFRLLSPEIGIDEELVWTTAKRKLKALRKEFDIISNELHKYSNLLS